MKTSQFQIHTTHRSQMIDVTERIHEIIRDSQFSDGMCQIFVPHTTAGLTINENADPDVQYDCLKTLDKIVPWIGQYHHLEGNSAAHLKASMMGFSQTVIVEDGRLLLGTWQGIYFCEFDGPRMRKLCVKLIG